MIEAAPVKGEKPADWRGAFSLQGKSPGQLTGATKITLHTRYAQRLFQGRHPTPDDEKASKSRAGSRKKAAIPGCNRFGGMVKHLQLCSGMGDPYADLVFFKVDQRIEEARMLLEEKRKALDELAATNENFHIEIGISTKPITDDIHYKSPYAYAAARLVVEADAIFLRLLRLTHVALITREQNNAIRLEIYAIVRKVTTSILEYTHTGTTRKDFFPGVTARGQVAIDKFGTIPEYILSGEYVPKFGTWQQGGSEKKNAPQDQTNIIDDDLTDLDDVLEKAMASRDEELVAAGS